MNFIAVVLAFPDLVCRLGWAEVDTHVAHAVMKRGSRWSLVRRTGDEVLKAFAWRVEVGVKLFTDKFWCK